MSGGGDISRKGDRIARAVRAGTTACTGTGGAGSGAFATAAGSGESGRL